MTFSMLLALAVGLSMDAFAVSVINSMCYAGLSRGKAVFTSAMFGLFQGVMPLLGYWAGSAFSAAVGAVDHWIAFVLLGFIGGKMLLECLRSWNEPARCATEQVLSVRMILTQAFATSIDALAVGVSFAALSVNVYSACGAIAVITFVCCLAGHFFGKKFGSVLGKWAQLAGGIILVSIGVKILVEHLWG